MTYGEYYYLVKYDIKLINDKWVSKPIKMNVPKQMSREDATVYYAHKFREYWNFQNK